MDLIHNKVRLRTWLRTLSLVFRASPLTNESQFAWRSESFRWFSKWFSSNGIIWSFQFWFTSHKSCHVTTRSIIYNPDPIYISISTHPQTEYKTRHGVVDSPKTFQFTEMLVHLPKKKHPPKQHITFFLVFFSFFHTWRHLGHLLRA